MYDITNRESFNNVQSWIDDCKSQSPKSIFMVLIGNKEDLSSTERQVEYDEGKQFAEQ